MRRRVTAGLRLLMLLSAGGALYFVLHRPNLLADARIQLARGELYTAQIDLDSYLTHHPRDAAASYELGLVNLAQENGVSAERNFRLARDAGYRAADTVIPLGRAYILQRHFDEALDDFTLQRAPPGAVGQVLAVRALVYLAQNQIKPGREAANLALQRDPSNEDVALIAAAADLADGDLAAANAATNKVLARHPASANAMLLSSDLALAAGDAPRALKLAQDVHAAAPIRLDARLAMARALIVMARNQDAAALLNEICRVYQRAVVPHYLRAIVAVRMRDYVTADAQMDVILPSIDDLPLGNYLMAVTKLARNQPGQAEEASAAYAASHPGQPGPAKLLALTELSLGKPAAAEAALQQWSDAGNPDVEMLDLLSRAQAMRGDVVTSVSSLDRAASMAPKNIEVLNRLAAGQLSLGDLAAGEQALRQSLASAPDQPGDIQALVRLQLAAGDIDGANVTVARVRKTLGDGELSGVLTGEIYAATLNFAGARRAYEAALHINPDSRGATLGLVKLDGITGDPAAARSRLANWMHNHPADREGLALLVNAALAAHDAPSAIAAVEAAHEADPTNRQIAERLGRLYMDNGRPERAVALLERFATSNDVALLCLLAEAQKRNGHPDEANAVLLQAIEAAPHDPAPRLSLIAMKLQANEIDVARTTVADALTAIPGSAALLEAAVGVELHAGGRAVALAKAAALQADPSNLPAAYILPGKILAADGDPIGAANAYATAYHQASSHTLAVAAGGALGRLHRFGDAKALVTDWITDHGDDVEALELLASIDIATSQQDDASRWLDQVLQRHPNDVVALNDSAWIDLMQGNLPQARAHAQCAYTLAATPETADTLGWIIARQGDTATALPLLQQAVGTGASQASLYHEAFVLQKAGRTNDARVALDEALSEPSPFEERRDAEALRAQLLR
jgi:putative PEP-CTERM system TPR-repeat lipoprotein